MTLEKDLQKEAARVIDLTRDWFAVILDVKPVWYQGKWIKNQAESGVGDLLVVNKETRVCFMAELKRHGGKQNRNQIRFQGQWEYRKQVYVLAAEPQHIVAILNECARYSKSQCQYDPILIKLLHEEKERAEQWKRNQKMFKGQSQKKQKRIS